MLVGTPFQLVAICCCVADCGRRGQGLGKAGLGVSWPLPKNWSWGHKLFLCCVLTHAPSTLWPIVFWWNSLIQIIWKLLIHAEKNLSFPSPVNKFRSGTLNLWNLMVLKLTSSDGIVFSCNLQLISCSIALIALLLLLLLLSLLLLLL